VIVLLEFVPQTYASILEKIRGSFLAMKFRAQDKTGNPRQHKNKPADYCRAE